MPVVSLGYTCSSFFLMCKANHHTQFPRSLFSCTGNSMWGLLQLFKDLDSGIKPKDLFKAENLSKIVHAPETKVNRHNGALATYVPYNIRFQSSTIMLLTMNV